MAIWIPFHSEVAIRTKWSDALIEQEIRAVSNSVGHFPSANQLTEMGRGDLSNAICKNGGFVHWSERTGIARIHSDSDTGWAGERDVQAILELQGFTVSAKSWNKCPYDLIVNDRVRVDVKTAKQATYQLSGNTPWSAWYYRIGKAVQSDVVILYQSDTKACYVLPWWEVGTTNITISERSPKYDSFKGRFDILTSMAAASKAVNY